MNQISEFFKSNNITVIRPIGQGGFKTVFLVDISGKQEALKVTKLFDENEIDPIKQEDLRNELYARSKREVDLIKKLGGQNIVSLGSIDATTFFEGDKDFFIYSEEFIPGKTLDTKIQENGSNLPSWEQIRNFFQTGLDILQKFEQNKIIHRDIKPQNIMVLDDASRPFVFFDLGIAYDQQGTSLTARTFAPGTLRYRAPETLEPDYRSNLDIRSDLFSFAVTAFEYATGVHPIHPSGATPGETFYRLMKVNAEAMASKRPDLPMEFCNLIDRCLKKKPALRPRLSVAQKTVANL